MKTKEELKLIHGKVWTTGEMLQEFKVEGFASPIVVVKRMSDNIRGSLEFQHAPRFYFSFVEDK